MTVRTCVVRSVRFRGKKVIMMFTTEDMYGSQGLCVMTAFKRNVTKIEM